MAVVYKRNCAVIATNIVTLFVAGCMSWPELITDEFLFSWAQLQKHPCNHGTWFLYGFILDVPCNACFQEIMCSIIEHISVHVIRNMESSGLLLVMMRMACSGMFSYVCWLTVPASFNLPSCEIGWHDGWETFWIHRLWSCVLFFTSVWRCWTRCSSYLTVALVVLCYPGCL